MKLRDLKLSDVGKEVRVGVDKNTLVQGTLQHVATESVEDRTVFGQSYPVVTGYTLTVGGWTRSQLSPSTEVWLM